ncbi:MFS transporter [Lacticaseibacillus sp. GG6-2]
MAIAAAVVVANLNYIQPLEPLIATTFAVSKATVGAVAMLTQLGYALGLLFLVPLGDKFDRNHLIQVMVVLAVFALIAAYLAPNVWVFGVASLLIGITSVAPQMIIPFTAALTRGIRTGAVLGNVLSGLLTGILLSRAIAGLIAGVMAWQNVYLFAAIALVILLIVLHHALPQDFRGHVDRSYLAVLASLPHLLASQKHLQGAAINGFALFGASNVLWATLAFYLAAQFHLGSTAAGAMGLLGITGILFASVIGRLVDRYSPRLTIGMGIGFSTLAFLVFWFFGHALVGLIVGIVVLDLGTQFGQVSNQAIVQSLGRDTNSRNNSVFMFSYFLGGSLGTLSATWAWSRWGWSGVCAVAVVFLAIAIIGHLAWPEPKTLTAD